MPCSRELAHFVSGPCQPWSLMTFLPSPWQQSDVTEADCSPAAHLLRVTQVDSPCLSPLR